MLQQQTNKKPGAWICSNEKKRQTRGRIKVYQNSKLYLNDGDEFELELFNPTQKNIKADISIDGKSIGTGLILRPGQRIYLECFPDSKKKFTFKTYEVEDSTESKESISNNGFISIKFYNEITKFFQTGEITSPISYPSYPPTTYPRTYPSYPPTTYPPTYPWCNGNISGNINRNSSYYNTEDLLNGNIKSTDIISSTIETGQIDGGSHSDQEFESVSMDFDYSVLTEISYQLLPMSQKPVEVSGFKQKKVKPIKTSDKLEELLKLKELLDSDLINREEFDILKSEIV